MKIGQIELEGVVVTLEDNGMWISDDRNVALFMNYNFPLQVKILDKRVAGHPHVLVERTFARLRDEMHFPAKLLSEPPPSDDRVH
jgi:hypothetical protein